MLAGAAFSAVPAQAATLTSANTQLQLQLVTPDLAVMGKPADYQLTLTNNTAGTINNAIVGLKFGPGARLSSTIAGLPANSCVRGNASFGCLVTSLAPGASVTLTFTGSQTVSSAVDIAAAQAFVGGVFTTSSVETIVLAAAPATGGGGGTGGGGTGGGGTGGGGGAGL
jgi:hypothetical protein